MNELLTTEEPLNDVIENLMTEMGLIEYYVGPSDESATGLCLMAPMDELLTEYDYVVSFDDADIPIDGSFYLEDLLVDIHGPETEGTLCIGVTAELLAQYSDELITV